MKISLFSLCLFLTHFVNAQEPKQPSLFEVEFHDPRQFAPVHIWIKDGVEPPKERLLNNSILIICWSPAPDGTFGHYQISGLDGYHSKEQVERFLTVFYQINITEEGASGPCNVIVAGNNWGACGDLKPKLQELSKAKSFSVFLAGEGIFSKVRLIDEPEARLKLIKKAYKDATDNSK